MLNIIFSIALERTIYIQGILRHEEFFSRKETFTCVIFVIKDEF